MVRTAQHKPIAITDRDSRIFDALAKYRYLPSTYLHAFAGGASETRFKERLGDLFHEGFLNRPSQQWQYADARCRPAIYEIAERGFRLHGHHGRPGNAYTWLSMNAHRQFAHAVMICECLASIELATRLRDDVRFIAWPEIVERMPNHTGNTASPFKLSLSESAIIPDGLFGIEYTRDDQKSYRFFALEVDRGTMPIERADKNRTSLLGKLSLYQEAHAAGLHRSHLGVPNLLVLTLSTTQPRLETALVKLASGGPRPTLLFKAVEPQDLDRPKAGLLEAPWARPGLPALNIATAS